MIGNLILTAATLLGQCPPGQRCPLPTAPTIYRADTRQSATQPTTPAAQQAPPVAAIHRMSDSSGKVWSSPNAEWLAIWVGRKNADLAAAKAVTRPVATSPVLNYGLDRSRFPVVSTGRREWYGGNVIDPIGDEPETGDATRPKIHLTILGTESERKDALQLIGHGFEIADTVKKLGDQIAIQDYAPDDPMVADLKLANGGHPDVVVQEANGKVIFRSNSLDNAYHLNAVLVEQIRRVDPTYDPKKDPNGKDPLVGLFDFVTNYKLVDLSSISASFGSGKDQLLWAAIGVLALLLLVPKGQSQ